MSKKDENNDGALNNEHELLELHWKQTKTARIASHGFILFILILSIIFQFTFGWIMSVITIFLLSFVTFSGGDNFKDNVMLIARSKVVEGLPMNQPMH